MKRPLIIFSLLATSIVRPLPATETADAAATPPPVRQPVDTSDTGNGDDESVKNADGKKAAGEEEPDCE
jgi:hypothetical protein